MTAWKTIAVMVCVAGLALAGFAQGPAAKPAEPSQDSPAKRMDPLDAKSHMGENATVCGKVVDTKVAKNGLAGHGFPASYYLDAPATKPIFYFTDFVPGPESADQTRPDYIGKRMCVTGTITPSREGVPFIMALKHSQVKAEAGSK
jgi:hypothetical protein